MTGAQLKQVRETIDVDPFAFAAVLGVHVSTIYRWEATRPRAKQLALDPLQDQIATVLYKRLRQGRRLAPRLRLAIIDGLTKGGTLVALHALLSLLLER